MADRARKSEACLLSSVPTGVGGGGVVVAKMGLAGLGTAIDGRANVILLLEVDIAKSLLCIIVPPPLFR